MKLALPANTNQTATVVVMTDVTDIVTDTGHHVLHSMLAWLYSTSIQPLTFLKQTDGILVHKQHEPPAHKLQKTLLKYTTKTPT